MNNKEVEQQRLKLLHRSLDRAHAKMKEVLHDNDEIEVILALKALLNEIFSIDEMHFKETYYSKRDSDENGKYLNGLRYAANLLKHERRCIEIHNYSTTPKFSFPFSFPVRMGEIEVVWKSVDTTPNPKRDKDKNFINQKEAYNNLLVGNGIFKAIDAGIEYLNEAKLLSERP